MKLKPQLERPERHEIERQVDRFLARQRTREKVIGRLLSADPSARHSPTPKKSPCTTPSTSANTRHMGIRDILGQRPGTDYRYGTLSKRLLAGLSSDFDDDLHEDVTMVDVHPLPRLDSPEWRLLMETRCRTK